MTEDQGITFISPKSGTEYVIDQTIIVRSKDGSSTMVITPESGLDYELALGALSDARIAKMGKQLADLRQAIGRYQYVWLHVDDFPSLILHSRREEMFRVANIDSESLTRLAPAETEQKTVQSQDKDRVLAPPSRVTANDVESFLFLVRAIEYAGGMEALARQMNLPNEISGE